MKVIDGATRWLSLLALFGTACAASQASPRAAEPSVTVVPVAEVAWEALNPARGDQSPKAGSLWGDRKGAGPSGFLVEFVDGFSSPPHIHNVSYRAVVIRGLVHNDDPNAEPKWMSPGSFWTQPSGDVHITSAKGEGTLAYVEIDEGPYLVRPVDEAYENDAKPMNLDTSDMVWANPSSIQGDAPIEALTPADGAKVAVVWQNPTRRGSNGALIKLQPGSAFTTRRGDSTYRIVIAQGAPTVHVPGKSGATLLSPGSYVEAVGASARISCEAREDCIVYVRTEP